jgi:hypothetical protein
LIDVLGDIQDVPPAVPLLKHLTSQIDEQESVVYAYTDECGLPAAPASELLIKKAITERSPLAILVSLRQHHILNRNSEKEFVLFSQDQVRELRRMQVEWLKSKDEDALKTIAAGIKEEQLRTELILQIAKENLVKKIFDYCSLNGYRLAEKLNESKANLRDAAIASGSHTAEQLIKAMDQSDLVMVESKSQQRLYSTLDDLLNDHLELELTQRSPDFLREVPDWIWSTLKLNQEALNLIMGVELAADFTHTINNIPNPGGAEQLKAKLKQWPNQKKETHTTQEPEPEQESETKERVGVLALITGGVVLGGTLFELGRMACDYLIGKLQIMF